MVTVVADSQASANHLPVGQSVVRGALALLSTQPLTWGASLLMATVVPRLLGSELLGQYAIVIAIGGLVATLAGLGIPDYLVRRFAQNPRSLQRDAGVALGIQTVSACLVTLCIAALWPLVPSHVISYALLLAGLLPVVGSPAQTVLLSSFRGRERHRSYAWFNACFAVLSILGLVFVLLAGGDVVEATLVYGVIGIATSATVWILSGIRPAMPNLRALGRSGIWEFVRGGLPFLTWQLTLLAYGQIDRLLLGFFVPTSEVGWYAAAYQCIGVVVFVPTIVIAPLFPALSRSTHDPAALRNTITGTLRTLLTVMGLLCVGSITLAPGVPRLFGWPDDFANAVPLMTILALHLPVVAVDMVLGAVLMAMHRESRLVLVGLAAVVFNIGANFVAIPYFEQMASNGAIGASIITVLTEVLMCVGAVIVIRKDFLDPSLLWHAARLLVCGAIATIAGVSTLMPLMASVHILVALAAAGTAATLVYAATSVVLRAVRLDDVQPLIGRFRAVAG